jgi:hypothetical protein
MGIGTLIGKGVRFLYDEDKEQKRLEAEAEERRVRIEAQKVRTALDKSKLQHERMVQAITSTNGDNFAVAKALSDHHPGEWDYMVDPGSTDPDGLTSGFFMGKYRRNSDDTGFERDPASGDRIFDKRMGSDGNPMIVKHDSPDQKMLWLAGMMSPDLFGALSVQRAQNKDAIIQAKKIADVNVGAKAEVSKKTGATALHGAQQGLAEAKSKKLERETELLKEDEGTGVSPATETELAKQPTFLTLKGKEVKKTQLAAKQLQDDATTLTNDLGVPVTSQEASFIKELKTSLKSKFRADLKKIVDNPDDVEGIKQLRELYVGRGVPAMFFDQALEAYRLGADATASRPGVFGRIWNWLF